MFGGSRSGNSERANFTAPHSTCMPAGQQVDAVNEYISKLEGVKVIFARLKLCEVEHKEWRGFKKWK